MFARFLLHVCSCQIMHVTAGELIRLPCAGMPDVVPGPPQVFFEKDGREELLGSSSGTFEFLYLLLYFFIPRFIPHVIPS